MLASLFKNWQTALAGILMIGLGIFNAYSQIQIPGVTNIGLIPSLIGGLGLILAKDAHPTTATTTTTATATMPSSTSIVKTTQVDTPVTPATGQ